jgi:signal transduction histidine kinase
VLDEFGLVSAIREYVTSIPVQRIQITFDGLSLFRISCCCGGCCIALHWKRLRTSLNAQAPECQIRIKAEDNVLLIEIADNGKGLPSEHRAGIGFHSMRERASELGGTFSIEKNSTGGVTVQAKLPLRRERSNDH